jgi:hypothetical protein
LTNVWKGAAAERAAYWRPTFLFTNWSVQAFPRRLAATGDVGFIDADGYVTMRGRSRVDRGGRRPMSCRRAPGANASVSTVRRAM